MPNELREDAEARRFTSTGTQTSLMPSREEMAAHQVLLRKSETSAQSSEELFGSGFSFAACDDIYRSLDQRLIAQAPEKHAENMLADRYHQSDNRQESELNRLNRVMNEHYASGEIIANFVQRPGVRDAIAGSVTFAHAIQDLNDCKWGRSIRIWRGHPTEITDYSADHNLMEIDSKEGARRQAEVFAHEAYHATHQDLDKLYGTSSAVSRNDFVAIKMHQESGAFLQEIRTNEELHRSRPKPINETDDPNKRIEYMWVDKTNPKSLPHKQIMNDLLVHDANGHVNEKASLERIEKFLRSHPAALRDGSNGFIKDSNGNYIMKDYQQHYSEGYGAYTSHFDFNRGEMLKRGYMNR